MTATGIKITCLIVAFILIVVIVIYQSLKHKNKESMEDKQSSLDIDIKDDTYWENRFKGLKNDYEDREKYHNDRYERLKSEYENREGFLREMLDDIKNDYTNLKTEVNSIQEIKTQLESKLKEANRIIANYEIRFLQMESKLKEICPNIDNTYFKLIDDE